MPRRWSTAVWVFSFLVSIVALTTPVVAAPTIGSPARVLRARTTAPRRIHRRQIHRGLSWRLRARGRLVRRKVHRSLGRARSRLAGLWRRGDAPSDEFQLLNVKVKLHSVADWSTASLLMAGARDALRFGARLGPITGSLTGVGAVGLGVYSVHGMVKGKTTEKRLEAAHGFAWSLQGLAGLLHVAAPKVSWLRYGAMRSTGIVLGVGGGLLQAGLGVYRLATGLSKGERRRIVLGSLDLSAGLCWAASACALGGPAAVAGFVGLTVARFGYTYKEDLRNAARRLFGKPPLPKSDTPKAEEAPGPKVIVTKPTTAAAAAKASRSAGVTTLQSGDGKTVVVTGATVRDREGQEHPAVVVTPVE